MGSCIGAACVKKTAAGAGWGLHFMIQQAYFHNMPLAFASAEWEEYIDINLEFQPLSDRFERVTGGHTPRRFWWREG